MSFVNMLIFVFRFLRNEKQSKKLQSRRGTVKDGVMDSSLGSKTKKDTSEHARLSQVASVSAVTAHWKPPLMFMCHYLFSS